MRYLIIIVLLFGQGCSTDKKEKEQTDAISNSETNNEKDKFETKDEVYFKQYVDEKGQYITEQQKVTFDYGSGKTKKPVFVHTKLNTKFIGGTEQAINKLNIKAYTTKENENQYDQLIWELNKDDEETVGLWGEYFKTVVDGCCGAEAGYTLYDIETGKEFLKFHDLRYASIPYYMLFGYTSLNTMTFENPGDKTVIGNFFHGKEDLKTNEYNLTTFTVHSKSQNGEHDFTPEISLESKRDLKDIGFFKTFQLFQSGDSLKTLDTADYYIVLKYYSLERSILLPIDKNGLRELEYVSNDKELSKDWVMKKK